MHGSSRQRAARVAARGLTAGLAALCATVFAAPARCAAGVLFVICATLAAAPPSAQAESACSDPDAIWCATLTVADLTYGTLTYGKGYDVDTSQGALSNDSFSYDDKDYEVEELYLTSDDQQLRIHFKPTGKKVFHDAKFAISVDGTRFNFGDAGTAFNSFEWPSSLSWDVGDTVEVEITCACDAVSVAQTQAQVDVPGNWELKPPGLQAGDEFRLLLRTKNRHYATSTNISDYDTHVQGQVAARGHAALKEYSTHFRILGSTATVDARAHNAMTGSGGVPVYWLNGAKVADDNDDFFDGSWTSKSSGRGVDGELLGGAASRQILCTGTSDDGTATNLPLGGGDPDGDSISECTATSVRTASSTLGGRTSDVDDPTRYLALSGVFRVADSSRPRVERVAITSDPGLDGEYVVDDIVTISVTFSEAVTVTGQPRLRIRMDSGGRHALYAALQSTPTDLVFQYQVRATDYDLDGIGIPAAGIVLPENAAIENQSADADAVLAHEETGNQARHKIHVKPDAIGRETRVVSTPSVGGNYTTGETITIEVAFDRNVQVYTAAASDTNTGIPSFVLYFGVPYDTTPRPARYARVVGGNKVQFDYVVQAGDLDPDGILSHDPGVVWNGGAIMRAEMDAGILTDGVGNDDTQLWDVRADVFETVLLVQRAHTVNLVATGIKLSTSQELVDEQAGTLSLAVTGTLNGPPLATDTTVTVSVGRSGDNATEGTDYSPVSDFTLTIAAGESSGTASFSLTPTDDELIEGDESISVTGSTTATDLGVTGTSVVIVDNDDRGVVVSATALGVPEGGNSPYTVVLKSKPSATVTVTPSVTGSPDVTVSPTSLSFTTSTWSEAQTVTVSAARDDDAADDTATVTHTVSGGDYASVTAADVAVTVDDDTSVEVALTVSATSVREAAGATSITVTGTLNGAPRTADTAVTVAVGASGDAATEGTDYETVDEFTLTISAGRTSGTATFSLTPTNDAAHEGDETLSVTGSTAATGLTVIGTTVKITDDDLGVSVLIDDAEANEDDGQVVFTVSLSKRLRKLVWVDFETVSGGTATEGVDYYPQTTKLWFRPGKMSVQAGVGLIDDPINDDGETVMVRIGNARVVGAVGKVVRTLPITTATATGTIRNTDLMPQAWLARFGRTVADQVMEAVEARVTSARSPGSELQVAGQSFGGADATEEEMREAEARLERLSTWFRDAGDEDEDALGLETRAVSGRDVLAGTSFALTEGSAESGFGGVWGRGTVMRFDGREDDLTLEGEVESALLGADVSRGRWAAGLAVGHSRAEGGYASPQGDGAVESTLTGVYPYGRYDVDDWLSLWGVVGFGTGSLTLTPEGMDPIETDMDLRMAAAGLRSVLVDAPADGGFELAVTSDAMAVETTSDEVRGSRGSLAASEAGVTRLRAGLEGRWRGIGSLEPSFEIGVRQDGGDAETGFGADIGAGLTWREPALGIEAGLDVRGLLTHEDGGFRERGFAGSLAWDPAPETERGARLTLSQTVGSSASGGMEALLRPGSARLFEAANDDGEDELRRRRFEARLGYGWSSFGGRYTAVPEVGIGWTEATREVSHSWRLAEAKSAGLVFGLDVEAVRLERVGGDAAPEHRFVLGLGWRLEGARAKGVSFETRLEAARRGAANDDAGHRIGIDITARW